MEKVLKHEQNLQYIIHLGDEHDDIDYFPEFTKNINIITVPGLYHRDYHNPRIPNNLTFTIDNWKFNIAHTPKELNKSDITVNFYMHGHTHEPFIVEEDNHYLLNPGHLKAPLDRGFEASYLIMELNFNSVLLTDYLLNGIVNYQLEVQRNVQ